ncbi:hypothetical protein CLOM_g8408 [Closterium sp. NIES-68]|nr:hypothetical protein CLOM_g8408 [Closterium sp. NIES-68]GJP81418.1 hypothetical protein CLOP_g11570 [Closterium sp. NIES-67]
MMDPFPPIHAVQADQGSSAPYGGSSAVSRSRLHRSHSFTGANPHMHYLPHRLEHPLLSPSAASNPPLAFVLCSVSLFPVASLKGRQSLFAWLLLASSLTCLFFFSGFNRLHLRVRSAASASSRATPAPLPPLSREDFCASTPAGRGTSGADAPESVLLRWSGGSGSDGSARLRGNSAGGAAVGGARDMAGGIGAGDGEKAATCSKCRTLQSVLEAAVKSAAGATGSATVGGVGGESDTAAASEEDVGSASPAELLARAARRSVIVVSFSEAWAPMMRFFLERLRAVEAQERRAREETRRRGEGRVQAGVEREEREGARRAVEGEATGRGRDDGAGAGEDASGGAGELGGLVARLVVVAYDDESFATCCGMGLNCYMDWQEDAEEKDDFSGGQKHFMTRAYIHLVWRKVHVVHSMLRLGYDVLFTDTDILWLHNPLPLLWRHPHDLQMSADWWAPNARSVVANGGFYAARANGRTLRFFQDWLAWHRRCPQFRIQQVFNWIRPEANPFTRVASPLLLRYLPTDLFGGFCEMGHSLSRLLTVHANCCPGLGNKLPVLKQLAADWDFFSSLPVAARESMEERGFEWRGRNCSSNWNKLPRDTPVESS